MRGQRYAPMLGLRLCAVVAVLAVVASSAEGARSALCLSQRGASAPSVLAQEARFNPPSRCRGWPLLRKLEHGGDVVGVGPRVAANGTVTLDVVACGANATWHRSLSVFLSVYSDRVRDAVLARAPRGAGALRLAWAAVHKSNFAALLRPRLHHDLYAIDATPVRRRGGARSSVTHWLIRTQVGGARGRRVHLPPAAALLRRRLRRRAPGLPRRFRAALRAASKVPDAAAPGRLRQARHGAAGGDARRRQ